MGEIHWTAELRYMLLFLCLDAISSKTQGGFLPMVKSKKEAKEFNKLYRYLQENIMDMGRAAIGSMKAAKKDKEKIKV